jgi:transcriptional regulator with XRE-family HTH domain
VATVQQWSGLQTRALRRAMRMSVRTFAEHLGVAVRTVSKWENLAAGTVPRPDSQAILDTALARCDPATHLRFEILLAEDPAGTPRRLAAIPGPRSWDYESWSEDIERSVTALNGQNFTFAASLLDRWLTRYPPRDLDATGLYLFARTTALRGDLLRDQGAVVGPLSAGHCYARARSLFEQLDIPRRVAQLDLSLVVVTEMAGHLDTAARRYETLAADHRLSGRDRARALLWIGTALSKNGEHAYATRVMTAASRDFEDLAEPEDWSVAHQKLALAHRGAGDLSTALHLISVARNTATSHSPLQRVRLDTAYGHILLTDPATASNGLTVLAGAANLAGQYGMSHQLRSIEGIRHRHEQALTRR